MQRRREEDKKNRRSCNYSWVKEKKTVEMKNTVEAREGEPQFKSVFFFVGVRSEKID